MAVFEYRGIMASTGKAVQGVRDAENAKALRNLLRKDGVLLTTATEEKAAKAKARRGVDLRQVFGRASTADVAVMTRQLATLVGAKIPLFEALTALIEQVEKEQLRHVLTNVRDQVREGTSLAEALGSHPRIFSDMYVNMVRAGEASGTLEAVLERLTHFIENQSRLQGKVVATLAYPLFLAAIATVMVGVMMVYVVPQVTSIFENMDKALPWYTELLIGVSEFLGSFWWVLLLLIGLGSYLFWRWKRSDEGKLKWDGFVLRAPLFGKLFLMISIARFSRTLGTLLGAGVPLLSAMNITRSVLGNAALEKIVESATGSIRMLQRSSESRVRKSTSSAISLRIRRSASRS